MQKKTLGILLSTPPQHTNTAVVLGLLEVAGKQGISVSLYFIDDGVHHLEDSRFPQLHGSHIRLYVCAYGCLQRHIPTSSDDRDVTFCGLVVLSNIVQASERFIALN